MFGSSNIPSICKCEFGEGVRTSRVDRSRNLSSCGMSIRTIVGIRSAIEDWFSSESLATQDFPDVQR